MYRISKIILATCAFSALTGCGWFQRKFTANITGWAETCVDGVTYLQFPSGVSPKYTIDGKLVACK